MKHRYAALLVMLVVLAAGTPAIAHPGHDVPGNGFSEGLLHPLLGWDHLLAMLAIGLLSAQFAGVGMWLIPGTFVGSMICGGVLGISGWQLPGIELEIALSVLVLGIGVAIGQRFALAVPLALAAFFGFVHGQAHGVEMPRIEHAALYATGFVFTTICMHGLGLLAGCWAKRSWQGLRSLQLSGGLIAAVGCWLLLKI